MVGPNRFGSRLASLAALVRRFNAIQSAIALRFQVVDHMPCKCGGMKWLMLIEPAMCMIALDANGTKSTGNSDAINASNCLVQVNSNNNDAVDMSGSTTIKTAENCFVGKLHTYSPSSVSPAADATCNVLVDPFAGLAKPTIGACDYNKYKAPNNSTLSPGVYCGGLTISSTTVTFAPGLYIIKDGDLNASGTSTMTGNGVTFFLTGNGAGVTSSGGSSWHLVAAGNQSYPCTDGKTGCLAGFVFYLDASGAGMGGKLRLVQ